MLRKWKAELRWVVLLPAGAAGSLSAARASDAKSIARLDEVARSYTEGRAFMGAVCW